MKLSSLKIDAKASLDGAWVREIDGFGPFGVFTRSISCPQAERYQTELYMQILGRRTSRKDKTIPPEVREYVQAKTLIEVCVLDWENAEDEAGAPLPFSKAALEALLLVDAPDGIASVDPKTKKRRLYFPADKKAFNYELRPLYLGLVGAALDCDEAPDDGDDDDAGDGTGAADAEKNA